MSSPAATYPAASSSPDSRSESCTFIWHPWVRTSYVRGLLMTVAKRTAPGRVAARPGGSRPPTRISGPVAGSYTPWASARHKVVQRFPMDARGRKVPTRGFARGAREMTVAGDEPERSGLVCVTVTGVRAPMSVLEALSFPRDRLPAILPDLQRRAGVSQVCLVTTCERVELYAYDAAGPDPDSVVRALANSQGVPVET